MMPRTSDRVADEKSLFQRSAVMRADGSDREYRIAAPGQQHRFALRMSEQHGSISDRSELHALCEIRPAKFYLFLAHSTLSNANVAKRFHRSEWKYPPPPPPPATDMRRSMIEVKVNHHRRPNRSRLPILAKGHNADRLGNYGVSTAARSVFVVRGPGRHNGRSAVDVGGQRRSEHRALAAC